MEFEQFQKYFQGDPEGDLYEFLMITVNMITFAAGIILLLISNLNNKPELIKVALMFSNVRNMISSLDI